MPLRLILIVGLIIASLVIAFTATHNTNKIIDVKYSQLTSSAKKQVDCLAENIYFESAHEPYDGRVAVALVTMNRVQDPRYPNDICSVVKQRVKSICQFSWYCEHNKYVRNNRAYNEAEEIALYVYANYENLKDLTKGALFYHADYVSLQKIGVPGLQKTVAIGRHIFYKERAGI
jgi:spore germination cell wall hydrolase CwlJ-like protein